MLPRPKTGRDLTVGEVSGDTESTWLREGETSLAVPFLVLDGHRNYLAVENGGCGGAARRGPAISRR